MKEKLFIKIMMIAVVFSAALFTGCSSDDDDGNGGEIIANGVHKIEVSLSGEYSQFSPVLLFSGIKRGGAMSLVYDQSGKSYENILNVNYQGGTATAYSEGSCFEFYVSIMLSNASAKAGSVNISCKGYVDGKITKSGTQTITFAQGELAKAAYFNSVDGFKDVAPK